MLNQLKNKLKKRRELKTYIYVLKLFKKALHPAYLKGGEHGDVHEINLRVYPPLVFDVGIKQRIKGKKTGNKIIEYKDFQNSVTKEACGVYLAKDNTHFSPKEPTENIGKERILYNGDLCVLAHEYTHYLTYHLKDGGIPVEWGGLGEILAAVTDYIYFAENNGFWNKLRIFFYGC